MTAAKKRSTTRTLPKMATLTADRFASHPKCGGGSAGSAAAVLGVAAFGVSHRLVAIVIALDDADDLRGESWNRDILYRLVLVLGLARRA